jgi:TM2 domain-containing membrane protein YozV
MKKAFIILAFTGIACFAKAENVSTSSYQLDETAIVNTINAAEDITPALGNPTLQAVSSPNEATTNVLATQSQMAGFNKQARFSGSDKNATTAVLLSFFLGDLGIHRFYMGTATLTGVGYILTLGGCGIVNLIDFITLIIHMSDISPYVDNTKFFMW